MDFTPVGLDKAFKGYVVNAMKKPLQKNNLDKGQQTGLKKGQTVHNTARERKRNKGGKLLV